MAFQRSVTTEELVAWLSAKGLHPDDCSKLKDEKFTGESFLILEKDDLKELGIGFAGRRLLGNLVEEAKNSPAESVVKKVKNTDTPAEPVVTKAKKVTVKDSDDEVDIASDEDDDKPDVPYCMEIEDSSDDEGPQGDDDSRAQGAAGAWIQTKKMWGSRTILTVYFLNSSILDRWMCGKMPMNTANILAWAGEWNTPFYEKIPKFEETDSKNEADIRVEFTESGGCWSMVGTDARKVKAKSKPTMCLNLKGHVPDFQKSLVIHEFGHSLGLEHEHQRSDFWSVLKKHLDVDKMRSDPRLKGNKSKMGKAAYNADWSKKKKSGETSEYDPKSIMHYWFDVGWLKNKRYRKVHYIEQDPHLSDKEKAVLKGIHERHNNFAKGPSRMDLKYLGQAYDPSGASGPVAPGDSGDDSDMTGSDDDDDPEPKRKTKSAQKGNVMTMSAFERLGNEKILELVDDVKILDEDDDSGDVMKYLKTAAGDWQSICKSLHVKASRIREFSTNYGHDSARCMDSAVADWLSLNYNIGKFGKPTWRKVAESVVRVNNKLFLSIASEHTSGDFTVVPDSAPVKQSVGGKKPVAHAPSSDSEEYTEKESIVLNVNTHLRHVKNALLDAAYLWNEIGQALDITPGTLTSIGRQYRGNDNESLNEMLTKWMHGGKATMNQLLEALEDPSVKRHDIVLEIEALKGDKRRRVGLA